ncbi:MAG: hypothetical protein KC417_08355, partial [Myxococcales bacterium]|nr:hypothetical protein [Myxococcales bacterium]
MLHVDAREPKVARRVEQAPGVRLRLIRHEMGDQEVTVSIKGKPGDTIRRAVQEAEHVGVVQGTGEAPACIDGGSNAVGERRIVSRNTVVATEPRRKGLGNRRLHVHAFPVHGMREFEFRGVKKKTWRRHIAVGGIARHGCPLRRELGTDLVCTPRLKGNVEERPFAAPLAHAGPETRGFAVRIPGPHHFGAT